MGIIRKIKVQLQSHHGAGAEAPRVPTTTYGTTDSIVDRCAAEATLSQDTICDLVANYRKKADKPKTLPKCFESKSDAALVISEKDIKAVLKAVPALFTIQYLIKQKAGNLEDIIKTYKIADLTKEYKAMTELLDPYKETYTFSEFRQFIKQYKQLPSDAYSNEMRKILRRQGISV